MANHMNSYKNRSISIEIFKILKEKKCVNNRQQIKTTNTYEGSRREKIGNIYPNKFILRLLEQELQWE